MTAACVKISSGVAGGGRDREVVWIVSVHLSSGADDPQHEWGIHSEEEDAEDDAAERGARLGLPVVDERDTPPSNVVPFIQNKGK